MENAVVVFEICTHSWVDLVRGGVHQVLDLIDREESVS